MNTPLKVITLLLALSCIVIPASAATEEVSLVFEDAGGHLLIHHMEITTTAELPHHAELSPFFREDDLIEIDEPSDEEFPEEVTAWFTQTGNTLQADEPDSYSSSYTPDENQAE